MKPLLILLCTVACTLAGWLLGGSKGTPQAHAITDAMSRATPPPTPAAPVAKRPHTTDVHAIIDRLNTEFGGEEQTGEMAGRLYAELQDLPSKQFAEAIANLSADGKFHAGDPAALLAGLWAERDLPAARAWMLGMKGDRGNIGRAILDTWA